MSIHCSCVWFETHTGSARVGLTLGDEQRRLVSAPVRALSFVTAGVRGDPLRFWIIRPTLPVLRQSLVPLPSPDSPAPSSTFTMCRRRCTHLRELDVELGSLNGSDQRPGCSPGRCRLSAPPGSRTCCSVARWRSTRLNRFWRPIRGRQWPSASGYIAGSRKVPAALTLYFAPSTGLTSERTARARRLFALVFEHGPAAVSALAREAVAGNVTRIFPVAANPDVALLIAA